jgi:hypothetical protein
MVRSLGHDRADTAPIVAGSRPCGPGEDSDRQEIDMIFHGAVFVLDDLGAYRAAHDAPDAGTGPGPPTRWTNP